MDPSPTRVLLVSDNQDELELYESGLAIHGFEVRAVGLESVTEEVARSSPALLLLNLRLGDPRTWSILTELRCGSSLGVPGVLLTGSVRGDAANRIRAHADGCAAFVAKPCTPDALAKVLRAVLAGARDLTIMDSARYDFPPPAGLPPDPSPAS